jgi:hypothetical protein
MAARKAKKPPRRKKAPAKRRKKASPKGAKATSRKAPRSRKPAADAPDPGGAPSIDWTPAVCETIRLLASFRNTVEDIAVILGVSKSALESAISTNDQVGEAFRSGTANFRSGLRLSQVKSALEGNASMLRWLGVNELGQRDVKAVEFTGTGEGGAVRVEADLGSVVTGKIVEFLRSRGKT